MSLVLPPPPRLSLSLSQVINTNQQRGASNLKFPLLVIPVAMVLSRRLIAYNFHLHPEKHLSEDDAPAIKLRKLQVEVQLADAPEPLDRHYHEHHHHEEPASHHDNAHKVIGVSLVFGFIFMLLIDQIGGGHSHGGHAGDIPLTVINQTGHPKYPLPPYPSPSLSFSLSLSIPLPLYPFISPDIWLGSSAICPHQHWIYY